jgi:hypothetical protein
MVAVLGSRMVAECITSRLSTVDLLTVRVVHGCSTEVAAVLVQVATVRTHQGTKLVALVELDSLYGGVSTQAAVAEAEARKARQQSAVAAAAQAGAF